MTVNEPPTPAAPRKAVRCRTDVVLLAVGLLVLALTALPVERHSVPGAEQDVFEAVNDGPSVPFAPVWVLMQMGNVVIVAVATLAALLWRKPRLAGGLAAGGVLVYVLAKVIKRFVVRGRPAALLADVVIRGDRAAGLGYVSGHAAVITVLAVVAAPYLSRRLRWAAYAVAFLVCVSRMYVGAHLPLDVIGGAGLGMAAGAVIRLAFGRPEPERAAVVVAPGAARGADAPNTDERPCS
ncbi:MAG: phosphatase PAP2 family protein [Actinomycetota bacterium]|nr:phosphatase PAP2 family protein [Actinomycetota bacterium]